jgi:hypothetical protein
MLHTGPTGSWGVLVNLYGQCQNTFNPYFTWSLTQKSSQVNIVFTADDVSTNPYLWNYFTLSIALGGTTPGLTQGLIPIYPGEWEYNIYEMTNQYDLNLNNSLGLVNNGILRVAAYPFEISGATYSGNNYTISDYRYENI